MSKLTRETANAMKTAIKAIAPDAQVRVECREGCAKLDDGSYGPIVETWSVEISLACKRTGNQELVIVHEDDASVKKLVRDVRKKLTERANRTRRAIATERAMDQE